MQRFEMFRRADVESWSCNDVNDLYQNIAKVGSGTYGEVHKARVKRNPSQIVALKKIKDATETEGFPITALREIGLLQQCDHPNIVKLLNVATSKNKRSSTKEGKSSTYLVFEYMDHELLGYIETCKLNQPQVKCIMKQILEGLAYLHDKDIIHRDIKSANILVNNNGEVKIADFGLAKYVPASFSGKLTQRVVTRWYRAPELLLGAKKYTSKIDMWALGCVFAELLIGRSQALFPAQKTPDQFEMICEKCGVPDDFEWPDHKNLPFYSKMVPKKAYSRVLSEYICRQKQDMDVFALDLLDKMLTYNPDYRISAADALAHPYFQSYPLPCEPYELPRVDQDCHTFIINNKRKNSFKASEASKQNMQTQQPMQYAKPKYSTKTINPAPVVLNNNQPAMANALPVNYQYNNIYNCNQLNQYNNIKNINVNLIIPSIPTQSGPMMSLSSQIPQMSQMSQMPQMQQMSHMSKMSVPQMSHMSTISTMPTVSVNQRPQIQQVPQLSQFQQISQMYQLPNVDSNFNFQPNYMNQSGQLDTYNNMYFPQSYNDSGYTMPSMIPMHSNLNNMSNIPNMTNMSIPSQMNPYQHMSKNNIQPTNNMYQDNSYRQVQNQMTYPNNQNQQNYPSYEQQNNYNNYDDPYFNNRQNMQEFYYKEPQILQKRSAHVPLDEYEPVNVKRHFRSVVQPYN